MSIEESDISQADEALLKKIEAVRNSLLDADSFMQKTQASTVALGIDLTALEINLLMKKLFLCVFNNLPETQYEWLKGEIIQKIGLIFKIIDNKFGKDKDTQNDNPAS